MATPFDRSFSLSDVDTLIRVSLLVRISSPNLSDNPERLFCFSLSNSFTVPNTPPEKITPLPVNFLVLLKTLVLDFTLTS